MICKENTADMPAILRTALEKETGMQDNRLRGSVTNQKPLLSPDQFQRELSYRAAMAVIRHMLREGLITRGEFVRIQPILAEKFSPVWGGLYPNDG